MPTLPPTPYCTPLRLTATPQAGVVRQGKAIGIHVKVKLPKSAGKQPPGKPDLGVIVTLPANTTLEGMGKRKKSLAGVVPINATAFAWQPIKDRGKRKLTAVVRVRVDSDYPYSVLPIGIAGFTGELCIGCQTTVSVPVLPPKHNVTKTKLAKGPKL